MKTTNQKTKIVASALALAGLTIFSIFAIGGNLEPTGPPAPTMKTLDEVEPRIPIPASVTPASTFVITEPGSYYLTGDRLSSGTGITIEANDVTIDLMGYRLTGEGAHAGNWKGIYIYGYHNVEIRNGTICHFGGGGVYAYGKGHRVINIRALSNGQAGYYRGIYVYADGLVKDCTITGSTCDGITVITNCIVTGNIIYDNRGYGIYSGAACTITGNTAYDNKFSGTVAYDGMGIYAGSGCTVSGNAAFKNENDGIRALPGCTVTRNAAYYNQGNGIYAHDACVLTANNARENKQTGIRAGVGCTVVGNTAYKNQYHGIEVTAHGLVDQNTAYDNNQSGGGYLNLQPYVTCTLGLNHAP
jgi:parallel beta-helix repeat protein